MHLFWTMTAADMRRFGDNSLDWVLHEAVAGEVFASGHSERGNDVPVLLSTSSAERVDGGYRFTGHKIFGSLSPVWTRLGIHAMDAGDAEGPQIVHAFLPRDTPGITIKQTWDTLGMRATQSQDTILDGAFVPDRYIARRLPAGTADLYVLCMSVAALGGIASVYLGIAHRALELAVASAHQRTSIALSRSMAYHPGVQHEIAEMALRLEAMDAQLERVVSDWDEGVDYGDLWALKIAAAKHNVCEGAKDVVDRAMTISGGGGLFRSNELERLYRDVRAGGFHPENPLLVHETIGKAVLGIDPNEEPRWG
jgi:alkylation response protein AidB-like acyl-CoA dehydrogenase